MLREAQAAPIRFVHGCGTLFSKFEHALEGHRVGDVVRVKLFPEDAFGKRNVDLIHQVDLAELPPGEHIEVGGQLTGTNESGEQVTFQINEIKDGQVKLDANHPLAGQALIFEIEIQGIESATEDQIQSGRVEPDIK